LEDVDLTHRLLVVIRDFGCRKSCSCGSRCEHNSCRIFPSFHCSHFPQQSSSSSTLFSSHPRMPRSLPRRSPRRPVSSPRPPRARRRRTTSLVVVVARTSSPRRASSTWSARAVPSKKEDMDGMDVWRTQPAGGESLPQLGAQYRCDSGERGIYHIYPEGVCFDRYICKVLLSSVLSN
jgi:hypothetical protein